MIYVSKVSGVCLCTSRRLLKLIAVLIANVSCVSFPCAYIASEGAGEEVMLHSCVLHHSLHQ